MYGMRMFLEANVTWLDVAALAFFVVVWIGYAVFSVNVNFNNGLRAYYFALAALTWFLHPWLMVAATGWVVYILYQREFHSKTLIALIDEDASPTLRT